MKREIIERLAIDSAVGEINDDARALFDAYLAEHPPASQWAEDIVRVYEETEATIGAKTRDADAGVGMPVIKINRPSRLRWRSFGQWAAIVALGILVGFAGGRWGTTSKTSRITFAKPDRRPTQAHTILDLKERYVGTFWGDKILASLENKPEQRYKAALHGVSFWDKYRQYIKEKSYE